MLEGRIHLTYVIFAVVSLLLWTVFVVLSKAATTGMGWQSAVLIAYIATAIAVVIPILMMGTGGSISFGKFGILACIGGIAGGLGGLTFYKALETGPVSVVAPIAGAYFITSAVIGIIFLKEPITASKIGALGLMIAAILLLSR